MRVWSMWLCECVSVWSLWLCSCVRMCSHVCMGGGGGGYVYMHRWSRVSQIGPSMGACWGRGCLARGCACVGACACMCGAVSRLHRRLRVSHAPCPSSSSTRYMLRMQPPPRCLHVVRP